MKALVLVANGTEEIEAVVTIDTLVRAKINVTVASVDAGEMIKCSRGVRIVADTNVSDVAGSEFNVIVMPGGLQGANTFKESAKVKEIVGQFFAEGKLVAAICAAPTAFVKWGMAKGKKVTSYPSFKEEFKDHWTYLDERVVVDGDLITSRGPGTSFEFALAIIEKLKGKEAMETVRDSMLVSRP